MKKFLLLGMAAVLAAILAGCGGGSVASTNLFGQTLSQQRSDGDVSFDPVSSTFTIALATSTGNVIFGINDAVPDPNSVEFRAFLDFPLDGSNGGDAIPLSATGNCLGIAASRYLTSAPSSASEARRPVERAHTRTGRPAASAARANRVPT